MAVIVCWVAESTGVVNWAVCAAGLTGTGGWSTPSTANVTLPANGNPVTWPETVAVNLTVLPSVCWPTVLVVGDKLTEVGAGLTFWFTVPLPELKFVVSVGVN